MRGLKLAIIIVSARYAPRWSQPPWPISIILICQYSSVSIGVPNVLLITLLAPLLIICNPVCKLPVIYHHATITKVKHSHKIMHLNINHRLKKCFIYEDRVWYCSVSFKLVDLKDIYIHKKILKKYNKDIISKNEVSIINTMSVYRLSLAPHPPKLPHHHPNPPISIPHPNHHHPVGSCGHHVHPLRRCGQTPSFLWTAWR